MKNTITAVMLLIAGSSAVDAQSQPTAKTSPSKNHLYIDVHNLEPGKVKFEDVAAAHQKDLATEGKYGVNFIKYWVDEKNGMVYCLSSAPDSNAVKKTHAEAHGLIPSKVYEVTAGQETPDINPENLYMDFHYLGAGNVTAKDVAEAHKKDLATEGKYDVSFINYWVDEKNGVVMCLSQANNEQSIIKTHTEAHGLVPASVASVKEGK
jgi:hypothetical protein